MTSCQIRWIVGILCLIAPSAILSTCLLTREASRPVLDRCPWTSLGSLLVLALGITSGIVVIFGCRRSDSHQAMSTPLQTPLLTEASASAAVKRRRRGGG